MNGLISIIVPIYNVAPYLPQCIESICNQTYKNIEIILVDDGSTDSCSQICDDFAAQDARICVIHKRNEGLVRARKDGLKIAKGAYIGYVDGDDWIEPQMYEQLFLTLREENTDIAMCGRFEDAGSTCKKVYHGIPAGRYDKKALVEQVYPNMVVNRAFFEWGIFPGVWDKLFRRECLERFQMLVDERIQMGEDAACTYPALLNADSIYILKECLYHYRQIPTSMVKQKGEMQTERQRFSVLYTTVLKLLYQYREIYDLTGQWTEYLLFLMVPRADTLLEGMERLDYLFPFPDVKRGSGIILYGMGIYGQRLYRFIEENKFCNVVACVDKNFEELQRQGMKVVSPDAIADFACDTIVIANSFAGVRNGIYSELTTKYPMKKVYRMDEKLVKSREVIESFGLMDTGNQVSG